MKYIKPIDVHVHLRNSGSYFFNHGICDAIDVGLCGLLEMPNPEPNLTTYDTCWRRQRDVLNATRGCLHAGINIGLTKNIEYQLEHALNCVTNRMAGVRADKTFYCHSTGEMGILDPELQRDIWMLKGKMEYRGVSIGHFEDETKWTGVFDPANPITHSQRQNEHSETAQVERQLQNAIDADFRGTFYIAHVTSPDTVRYIDAHRWMCADFNIVLEATWHHLFLNHEDYSIHGNRVKMNPPLRSKKSQEEMLTFALNGLIDIIGTDHAPHPIEKKDDKTTPASGVPALPFWPKGIELLKKHGINQDRLNDITFHTANETFGMGMLPVECDIEYNPRMWEKYGYNPFSRVDK